MKAHTEVQRAHRGTSSPRASESSLSGLCWQITHFFNLLFEPSAPIGKGSYHSSAIATLSLTRSMQMELGTEKEIGQREQREDAVPYGWWLFSHSVQTSLSSCLAGLQDSLFISHAKTKIHAWFGAGEVAQPLRALADLLKDPDLTPSTHKVYHNNL